MNRLITTYILENETILYNDGKTSFQAKFHFNLDRKDFRLYDISKGSLTEEEIGNIINEMLTYHYNIALNYLPKDISIENIPFVINGYNVSKKGYDMLTYYIVELTKIPTNEENNLKCVRDAFKFILNNVDKLGKEAIAIYFEGNRFAFLNFYMDLIHIIENYNNFPEEVHVEYSYKKRLFKHEFYLLPIDKVE